MSIKAVVFDIGNVLIEWHPEKLFDKEIGEERRKALFEEVDLHSMNELVDLGHHFKETVMATADKYPQWRDEIIMWHDRWLDMCSPSIDHSVQLLRSLRAKGIPVLSLSNFGIQTFEFAQTKYDFLSEFDQQYVSGYLATTKPSADIYEILETKSGFAPESLLFADDRLDNIEAAIARGWNAHQFEHPLGWADCLVSHGLLTQDEARFDG
jgi:2-haloacid dehalogenase